MADRQEQRSPQERATGWHSPSVWALIAANVFPLIGVLILGWNVRSILLVYWSESAVIGFYSIVKMAMAAGWGSLFLVPFFCVHFGLFMFVHGVFILALTDGMQGHFSPLRGIMASFDGGMLAGVGILFISHGFSFVHNHLRRGERRMMGNNAPVLMFGAYGRVVVMHLTLLFGAFLTMALGQPTAILLLLIVLKTAADLAAHAKQHGIPLRGQ